MLVQKVQHFFIIPTNLDSLKQLFSILTSLDVLGGDYMIPFCRDEILSRFAGIPAV